MFPSSLLYKYPVLYIDSQKLYNCSSGSAPQNAAGPETESSRATHPRNHSTIAGLVRGEVNVISSRNSTPNNETVPGMLKLGLLLIPNSWPILNSLVLSRLQMCPLVIGQLHSSKFQLQNCSLAGWSQQELQMWGIHEEKLWTHLLKTDQMTHPPAPSARKNPVSFGWSLNNVCKCHAHRPQLVSDCQIVIYLLIAHVSQLVLQAETFGRFGSSAINRFKRLSSSTACAKHQTII